MTFSSVQSMYSDNDSKSKEKFKIFQILQQRFKITVISTVLFYNKAAQSTKMMVWQKIGYKSLEMCQRKYI